MWLSLSPLQPIRPTGFQLNVLPRHVVFQFFILAGEVSCLDNLTELTGQQDQMTMYPHRDYD